jgi:hypothetical protein
MAVALKTRAAGLSDFLEPLLLGEINRITDTHFARTLTAAEAIANQAMEDAQGFAQTMTGTQPTTEKHVELTARMTEFDRAAQAALDAFDTAVFGIPYDKAYSMGISGTQRQMKGKLQLALKTAVSAPLEITKARIANLLENPSTTLVMLQNEVEAIGTLETRRGELGDTWLTEGLGATIDGTIEAFDLRREALQTRQGQLRLLTTAIENIRFAGGATMVDKWADIQTQQAAYSALLIHEDYPDILAESPIDPTLTASQAVFTNRLAEAKADTWAERATLIAGLSAQLDTLTTAGFAWAATLTTAETTARNTLPADLRENDEMKASLDTAKGTLNGLQDAVTTRVTAREALATATNSLDGWPAPDLSLNDIRTEVERARATFEAKEATMLLTEWDLATEARVRTLERNLAASILRRDTLIGQFQAIIATPLPVPGNPFDTPTQLSEKWTEILSQDNAARALCEANVAGTGTGLILDPQVAARIQETQANFRTKGAVTDVERGAFRDALNGALLTCGVMVLPTADGLLDTAAVQMARGMSAGIQANPSFQAAIASVRGEYDAVKPAITERITYRQGIALAEYQLGQVLRREQPSQVLTDHLDRLAAPADNDAFGEFDRVMGRQLEDIHTRFAAHQERVATATEGIQQSSEIITGIAVEATAAEKWAGLNAANVSIDRALGDAGALWAQRTDGQFVYHPDIDGVAQAAIQKWNAAAYGNVSAEADAIRGEASARLVTLMADTTGFTIAPTFEDVQTAVLPGLGIPAGSIDRVTQALDGLGIQAEIQSRVDLHAALDALETDKKLTPLAKKTAIDEAKALLTELLKNAAYVACDKILANRLQALEIKVYGAAAEEAAHDMLLTSPISQVAEARQTGTTSSLIEMGNMWQSLENKFQDPRLGAGWKYNVSLDDAFKGILDGTTPRDTDEYVSFLKTAIDRLNLQAGADGLPAPYKDIAETALGRLEGRNTGNPQLCAWAMSANLRLVMSVIETFGDTREAKVSGRGGVGDNNIALHEGITLKQPATDSLTGYSREHGALWSTLHSRPIDFLPIADLDEKNIPGSMLSAENIAALIEKMGTGDIVSIVGYVPADGEQKATLTQAGWASFCTVLGAEGHSVAFLEARWPVSDAPILLSELYRRLEALLKNEAEYKHLRYLFGRRLERVYQELVLESRQ